MERASSQRDRQTDKTDTKYIVQHLKARGEPACWPGRLSGAEHDSAPILAEPSRLGAVHAGSMSWSRLNTAAAASLCGTLLRAPWVAHCLYCMAGGTSFIPGSRLVVFGEMELTEL